MANAWRRAAGDSLALVLAASWIVATCGFVVGMRAAERIRGRA